MESHGKNIRRGESLLEAERSREQRATFKEFAHGDVIQTVRAVKDDTLHRQGLSEILRGLCLARACRTEHGRTGQNRISVINDSR